MPCDYKYIIRKICDGEELFKETYNNNDNVHFIKELSKFDVNDDGIPERIPTICDPMVALVKKSIEEGEIMLDEHDVSKWS